VRIHHQAHQQAAARSFVFLSVKTSSSCLPFAGWYDHNTLNLTTSHESMCVCLFTNHTIMWVDFTTYVLEDTIIITITIFRMNHSF